MNKNTNLVNYYAAMSTTARNKLGLVRRFYRMLYYRKIKRYCGSEEWRRILQEHERVPELVNPYPWPLVEPEFAQWEEDDSFLNYSLISDPAGMVVKYSTSYCACMVYAYTGKWLKYKPGEREANNWITVLAANGFKRLVREPANAGKYVGILKNENADYGHGLVVWFDGRKNGLVRYSTYMDHRYYISCDLASRFIWVEIYDPFDADDAAQTIA